MKDMWEEKNKHYSYYKINVQLKQSDTLTPIYSLRLKR